MSEDFKDNETAADEGGEGTPADAGSSVGGFFDSLIADFSLDDVADVSDEDAVIPEIKQEADGLPEVEIVDSLSYESAAERILSESDKENGNLSADDIIVLYDEEAEKASAEREDDESIGLDEMFAEDGSEERSSDESGRTGAAKFFAGIFPVKGDPVGEIIRKIVFLAAVCVFAVSGCMLVSTLIQSDRAKKDRDTIESIVTTTLATTLVTNEEGELVVETIMPTEEEIEAHNFSVMEYYKSMNPDVVGFIELEGCDIYQPVVQTTDNEYYLTHTYYNGENKAGSIFMDYRCTVSEDHFSPNIVLYGHNQQDGTMFGNLKLYKNNPDFYKENPIVKFNTDYGVGNYVIFAYFVTNTLEKHDSAKEVFHYQDYIETLKSPSTFAWYIYQVQKRSQIDSPVDVVYGDQLLVLSTCSNEYSDSRFVVIARRLRSDETVDTFNFSEASVNTGAKPIDWDAVMSVTTTTARRTYYTYTAPTATAAPVTELPDPEITSETSVTAETRHEPEETTVFIFETDPPVTEKTTSRTRRTTEAPTEKTTVSETTSVTAESVTTTTESQTTTTVTTTESVTETETSAETSPPETTAATTTTPDIPYSETAQAIRRDDAPAPEETQPPQTESQEQRVVLDE